MFSPLIISCLLICHQLLPFVLMEVIMLNRPRQFKCFFLVERSFDYVINDPPVSTDSKYVDWRAEDAQIRSCLWNSMKSKISCSLVFIPTIKLVWEQAKELYSSVNNLRRIYNFHQNYFTLRLGDLSLENYYNKFKGTYVKNSIFINPSPLMFKL